MTNLKQYQDSLADLMASGAFKFDPDLATISAAEYDTLINSMSPTAYEIAWQHESGLNIIEKCRLEYNTDRHVDAIVYESTWEELGLRVFEYQITTVPRTIAIAEQEPEHTTSIILTWWALKNGTVAHYRAMIDDTVIVSTGILNGIDKK